MLGITAHPHNAPFPVPMIGLVGDRPQRIWVADECDACHGTGRSQLPRGQIASDGGSTIGCRACHGEGVTNKRWEPVLTGSDPRERDL